MRIQTRQSYHRCVLQVLEHVVRCGTGDIRVPQLAVFAGFSRSHLSRLFYASFGEAPSDFIRRIRMERSAYQLRHTNRPVVDIAFESGLSGPEAFCRAFRSVFGMSPTEFKRSAKSWQLDAPSNFHWTPDSNPSGFTLKADEPYEVRVIRRKPVTYATLRMEGHYALVHEAFKQLERLVPEQPWQVPGTEIVSIYHDHPDLVPAPRRRSDIGFSVRSDYVPPRGLHLITLPGGAYACTSNFVDRAEHPEAWTFMNKTWIPTSGQRPRNIPALDVYSSWPLPWDRALSRLMVGLELDLGAP